MAEFNTLKQMMDAIPDEDAAIAHFTAVRWRDGGFCPYCQGRKVYTFKDGRTHKCAACGKRFSIKVGTIFEGTKLPLRTWMLAIWMITSHKKGIASTTLARDLGITQKSAWFVLHRLREAATTRSFNAPLEGTVEADETFVGGKSKTKHASGFATEPRVHPHFPCRRCAVGLPHAAGMAVPAWGEHMKGP